MLSHSPVSHSYFLLCLHCNLTLLMHSMSETWSHKIVLFWEEPFIYFRWKKYLTTNQLTNKANTKNLTKNPQRPIYLNYMTPGIPNPREYLFLLPKRQSYTFAASPRPFSDCFRLHWREEWEVNTASSLQVQCPTQTHRATWISCNKSVKIILVSIQTTLSR